jgi:hypothetical protein
LTFRRFQEYWDKQPNVITIRYEDLYTDQFNVFKKVLEECRCPASDLQIESACKHYPPQGGIMKYNKLFDTHDLQVIKHELGDIMKRYGYTL